MAAQYETYFTIGMFFASPLIAQCQDELYSGPGSHICIYRLSQGFVESIHDRLYLYKVAKRIVTGV